jgi:hypothetical protein
MRAIQPPSGPVDHVQRWANDLADDLRYGGNRTGIGSLLKHLGAQPLESGTSSGVADFMGSIPLGVLRMVKGTAELSGTPSQLWQGVKDTAGGALQASTIPSAFVAPESGEALEGAGDAIASQASKAAAKVKAPFSVKLIQPRVQAAITQAARDAAQEHGIAIPENASVRDVTQAVADAVRAKAHSIFHQLDSALGGKRFQTFQDQLDNINHAIRENLGIDPEKDAALQERFQDVTKARDAAMNEIRAKGLDPDDLSGQATRLHQRAMALNDVSKAVRNTTDVHPSASVNGTAPANVRIPQLFKRMQALDIPNPKYPGAPSRLVQAFGEQRADQLMNAVDAAHLYAQKIAARNAAIKTALKYTGVATGIEALDRAGHHLLGE